MGLSSRLFLLSADDTLHALASTAFMRMLRREDLARVPDFAGQRVRQASIVVEVVDGTPSRMVHWTFSTLDIDADGLLDVERFSTQQFARVEDPFEPASPAQGKGGPIIDAARRFVARGGSWEPDKGLLRRIEAAALGQVSCPRVRLVRVSVSSWPNPGIREGQLYGSSLAALTYAGSATLESYCGADLQVLATGSPRLSMSPVARAKAVWHGRLGETPLHACVTGTSSASGPRCVRIFSITGCPGVSAMIIGLPQSRHPQAWAPPRAPVPGPTSGLTLPNRERSGDPTTRAAGVGWVRGFAEPMETDW